MKIGSATSAAIGLETAKADPTPGEKTLLDAYAIVENTPEIQDAIVALRDLLGVDHVVYHSSKLGASPSIDPYIRLTYPASWIAR